MTNSELIEYANKIAALVKKDNFEDAAQKINNRSPFLSQKQMKVFLDELMRVINSTQASTLQHHLNSPKYIG